MKWIHRFQLFLFDFDGLLVNTEHLHFQAYVNILSKRGCRLEWSFMQFCELAHLNATALREAIYAAFPDLDSNWEMIYREKKEAYFELISSGKVELMPGVEPLLKELAVMKIRRCVVTNSTLEQTRLIASHIPALKTLPHWVTREDYLKPKPDPECYLRAISLYGAPNDRIIGFEDSLRGIAALKQTPALPILISPSHHRLIDLAMSEGIRYYPSFNDIPNTTQNLE